jgi:hypothetical protein
MQNGKAKIAEAKISSRFVRDTSTLMDNVTLALSRRLGIASRAPACVGAIVAVDAAVKM